MTRRLFIVLALFAVLAVVPTAADAQAKRAWVPPKLGVWKVVGSDEDGINWSGSLNLTTRKRIGQKYRYRGSFYWRSSDLEHSGREYFNGTFDRASGRFVIVGYRIVLAKGDLALGRYVGNLKERGRRIVRGSWGGADVVTGKWSARFSRSK